MVEGNAARRALEGIGREPADLQVLSVMYPNPGMFVVRGSSSYQSIEDLRGRRIAFGTRASGLRILARDVLDGLGLKPDRDFEQVILDKAADGPRLVLRKEVEAFRQLFPEKSIQTVDERFTSKMAQEALITGGMKKKQRREKGNIDKVSAAIILQSFLEQNS